MRCILTDVDEVLLNWSQPFEEWVRQHHPRYRHIRGGLRDHWHVEEWLGCSHLEARELIRLFNADPRIWPNLRPLPGVVDAVGDLHASGFQFVAITACATDEQTWQGRWHNLQEVFGKGVFDTLHCVGLSASKRPYLARYRPTFWVEDKTRHAIDGAEEGHTSFLINYVHNQRDGENIPGVTRVRDWLDIRNHIKMAGTVI